MSRERFEDLHEDRTLEAVPDTKRPKHDRQAVVAGRRSQSPEIQHRDDDEMIQEYEDDLKIELEALHQQTQSAIRQLRKSSNQ
ncbi:hypothetical protein KL918_004825 [Ogataea parapolymorpha]|uniref:Uncharacterized protein n=1 Tax=Ogataea parapolymorpha (strain ATCC 26012 / BCRC 20466 / JCM 22074 / NRRL Y-7560 / DL-1) TaxID=871575 RepID=W1QHM2_OGAPD|nr:hypothetical protein HPODL_04623 [Ogataea parapolymorpha DL-1]ESX01850.1 hypothetical protein HPODL_04623 [Ogataea parapolymorpha DL-1]KAG7865243.1 hypothetical protein KL918_004825 [Ogataea parapolymorpha]KAG7872828.1 hypothetical protein KL916_002873 [Ogataea parapolymorpha]